MGTDRYASPPAPTFNSCPSGAVERKFLRADGRKRLVARLLTTPASLGAHPAVLHVHLPCVSLALLGAQTTRIGASLEGSPGHRRLEFRLPGDDPASRGAY